MNINKVILMGRLTADPELKTASASNVAVCRFTVAVNRRFPNKDSGKPQADFIECTAFRQNAEFLSKFFHKGSSIIVFGSIQVDNWKDKDGKYQRSTKIIVDELQFGESKGGSHDVPADGERESFSNASNSEFFNEVKDADSVDADLPF